MFNEELVQLRSSKLAAARVLRSTKPAKLDEDFANKLTLYLYSRREAKVKSFSPR